MNIGKKAGLAATILGGLIIFVGLVILGIFLVKYLWAWTIPDLFPGAVKQGLIAKSLSWFAAFKVSVFIAVFGAIAHSGNQNSEKCG